MIATGYARFIALEESKLAHEKWITELSLEQKRVAEHVEAIERDRAMLERVHSIELRLGAMEAAQKERRR